MAKDALVTQSVLDRLLDVQREGRDDWPRTTRESVERFKRGVKRDLEWLLNSRQTLGNLLEPYEALKKSVFNYGLPDLTTISVNSSNDQKRLAEYLETTLATFEPRIAHLQVVLETAPGTNRMLKFRIEGLLRMDPEPEEISFDTVLELTSGQYQVK
jgi:type VI secretion system protein ImpF